MITLKTSDSKHASQINQTMTITVQQLGIVRKLDELGRLVVPCELRNILGWKKGDRIEMLAMRDGVYVRKHAEDGD